MSAAHSRHHVVRVVEIDRVDLLQIDEVLDLDRAREQRFERRQLARLDRDVAIRGYLVPLDDLA
jgi:hypothetical protein